MSEKTYTLQQGEKATQVMIGTPDLLIWGDLVTKENVQIHAYLMTIVEDFVLLKDAKVLFLAPAQQVAPVIKREIYVKREEILLFYSMSHPVPLPEESEVRRFEPLEALIGSFQVKGDLLKAPVATLENVLLVSKDDYIPFYRATLQHTAKPWLGSFASDMIQVRRDRMVAAVS